jgi:hypothetical protein
MEKFTCVNDMKPEQAKAMGENLAVMIRKYPEIAKMMFEEPETFKGILQMEPRE